MQERFDQAITAGQPERALFDQGRQVAALGAGLAVGFVILQRPGMLFAEAHGFGQPEAVERIEIRGGAGYHTVSRWRFVP